MKRKKCLCKVLSNILCIANEINDENNSHRRSYHGDDSVYYC